VDKVLGILKRILPNWGRDYRQSCEFVRIANMPPSTICGRYKNVTLSLETARPDSSAF